MVSQQVEERIVREIHDGDIHIVSADEVSVTCRGYDVMLDVMSGIDVVVVEEEDHFLFQADGIGTTLHGSLEKH